MSTIQIKNVSPEIHDAVRHHASEEVMTVSDYLLDLIQRDLEVPARRAWAARLATRQTTNIDVIAALETARAEREQEIAGG
ncbi:MAG TPA: hypothetical protein VF898_10310 [Chloroflexota bacterium]